MSGANLYSASVRIDEAAGTDNVYYLGVPHAGEWRLIELGHAGQDATAQDAANYVSVTVIQNAGSDTLASFSTVTVTGAAIAAGAYTDLTLAQSDERTFTGQGDETLKATVTNTGTGAAIDVVLHAVWEKVLA